MQKKGVFPNNVLCLNIPVEEVYKRTEAFKNTTFGCDRTILSIRLKNMLKNLPQTTFFYRSFYNNVTSIDGSKSRWFMQDVALEAIHKNIKALMEFSRDFFFD